MTSLHDREPELLRGLTQERETCDGCGVVRECLVMPSDEEIPYRICILCIHKATRA